MKSNIKFTGETTIVNGIELKRIGNAAFRDDWNICVGDYPEDECLNRIHLRSSEIYGFKDTVELEPGLYACTVKMRDGEEHFVFQSAEWHAQRYSDCWELNPDRLMYFNNANGQIDMFSKIAAGEIPIKDYGSPKP